MIVVKTRKPLCLYHLNFGNWGRFALDQSKFLVQIYACVPVVLVLVVL